MPEDVRLPLLPILVADLEDDEDREVLTGVAAAGGHAFIPLLVAPVDASTHLLEVHTPSATEPLVLLADPIGAPTDDGFPMRLRFAKTASAPPPASGARVADAHVRAKRQGERNLSASHERNLAGNVAPLGPEALVGTSVANGKLTIETLIGTGGVGAVYKAVHRHLRIPVAVKILHASFQRDIEFCRRFHVEALSASRLDHPNLVRVLDFGQEPGGLLYIAMEYLDGTPLSRRVEPGKPLPLERVVDIMAQVCAGLAHAHQRGIVHRDVKPENVVLVAGRDDDDRPVERVKVCDFGIAVQYDNQASKLICGTPQYMSPEQCRGEPLDGRSDVYACGVVLYELATGQVPFTDDDPTVLLDRHLNTAPLAPRLVNPEVDPALEAVILKALAKDPALRHGGARELRTELREVLAQNLEERSSSDLLGSGLHRPPTIDSITERIDAASLPSDALALQELATTPAAWLARLTTATHADERKRMFRQLASALPALARDHHARSLLAVRRALDMLVADGGAASAAAPLLHFFGDPQLLAWVAELALGGDDDAKELLVASGTQGAYALYSMRLKVNDQDAVRERFVTILGELGVSALPMIRAGLARLEPHCESPVASAMAEDLLLGAPAARDDETGEIVARYLRVSSPALVRAGIAALTRLWGERARPFLVALLSADDDSIRIGAIQALGQVHGLDDHVVRRIAPLANSDSASEALRTAVREAFDQARAALGTR